MISAFLILAGAAACLMAGRHLPRRPDSDVVEILYVATEQQSSELDANLVHLAGVRSQAAALESELAAMTLERNTWRERARIALHVASMPPIPCNPECAECRAARERRT